MRDCGSTRRATNSTRTSGALRPLSAAATRTLQHAGARQFARRLGQAAQMPRRPSFSRTRCFQPAERRHGRRRRRCIRRWWCCAAG